MIPYFIGIDTSERQPPLACLPDGQVRPAARAEARAQLWQRYPNEGALAGQLAHVCEASAAGAATLLRRHFAAAGRVSANEKELQDQIAVVLCPPIAEREVKLGPKARPDFMFLGDVAVEVKVAGGLSDLTRQLFRYAEFDRVSEILVVTTRRMHCDLPETALGKPLVVLCLSDYLL